MKLIFSIAITLISTQAMAYNYTLKSKDRYCKVINRTKEVMSLEKENKNILKVAINNTASCEISKNSPLLIYWILGEAKYLYKGQPTCQGLNMFERLFIKVKKNDISIINNKSFYWKSELLLNQFKKFPNAPKMDNRFRFELTGDEQGNCTAQAYAKIDNKEVPMDRIFIVRSGLSLKEIEGFDKGDSVIYLKK